ARFNVDANRIWAEGNSMGGSGAVSLGLRYANVFAAVYAGLPMTNYRASGEQGGKDWTTDQVAKWGAVASNLPIENRGKYAAPLARYNGMGVWDWQNHQAEVIARAGEGMAFLAFVHAMQDTTINWASEGQPWVGDLYQGRIGFMGADVPGDHSWPGYVGSDTAMIGPGYSGWDTFQFRKDMSFPALSNASGSG